MGEGEILEGEAGNGAGSLEGSVPYRQALPQYREAAVEAAQDADPSSLRPSVGRNVL